MNKKNKVMMLVLAAVMVFNIFVFAACDTTEDLTEAVTETELTEETTQDAEDVSNETSEEGMEPPDGEPPEGMEPPDGDPPEGMEGAPGGTTSMEVDHGDYAVLLTEDVDNETFESTGDSENAVRVDGETVELTDVTINKTAGSTATGDTSSFYGMNAGLLALNGANVTIENAEVYTSAEGANGIFSYGDDTVVTVSDSTIRTTENASGGVMVTGGGTMYVSNCDIETEGGSSAALRTDRGGGTLVVEGGQYVANGYGSPAVYCTADITVSDATLLATTSEAIVVEGQNSLTLINCDTEGNMIRDEAENIQNVMIYQSMSGDADVGKSHFEVEGGSLTGNSGDMIYVTNTACEINLTDVDLTLSNDVLLRVAGNDARNGWGTVGSNGGDCIFTAENQELIGNIIVDEISVLDMTLSEGSTYSGSINSEDQGGEVAVTIDDSSVWTLTEDSYITTLDASEDSIDTNGYELYMNGVLYE